MLENSIDNVRGSEPPSLTVTADVFDPEVAIQRLDGDEQLFAMLVSMYHQDSDALLDELALGVKRGDLALVQRAAHTLKGLAANLEAVPARDAAHAIEQLARAGELDGATAAAAELSQQLQSLRQALAQWDAAYRA